MGRQASIDQHSLIKKLTAVFRRLGFEGASLNLLQEASGLKKASLYHRFPNGKAAIAKAILEEIDLELKLKIFVPLSQDSLSTQEKIQLLKTELREFYDGGKNACLLNMLATSADEKGNFSEEIKTGFEQFEYCFTTLAKEAGASETQARYRAQKAIMLLQGSLVYCKGISSSQPFEIALSEIEKTLISSL